MQIVKRKGHKEKFDDKKLYASVYAACISDRINEERAEHIANAVTHETKQVFRGKEEVSSKEIQDAATEILDRFNSEVADLYKTHRDIS